MWPASVACDRWSMSRPRGSWWHMLALWRAHRTQSNHSSSLPPPSPPVRAWRQRRGLHLVDSSSGGGWIKCSDKLTTSMQPRPTLPRAPPRSYSFPIYRRYFRWETTKSLNPGHFKSHSSPPTPYIIRPNWILFGFSKGNFRYRLGRIRERENCFKRLIIVWSLSIESGDQCVLTHPHQIIPTTATKMWF